MIRKQKTFTEKQTNKHYDVFIELDRMVAEGKLTGKQALKMLECFDVEMIKEVEA